MAYINKEQVSTIREELKQAFPRKDGWKFSVRKNGHSSTVEVSILEAPIMFDALAGRGWASLNEYHINEYENGYEEFHKILDIMNQVDKGDSANFDHSDPQTDYFHVGWYVRLSIGGNKPFVYTGPELEKEGVQGVYGDVTRECGAIIRMVYNKVCPHWGNFYIKKDCRYHGLELDRFWIITPEGDIEINEPQFKYWAIAQKERKHDKNYKEVAEKRNQIRWAKEEEARKIQQEKEEKEEAARQAEIKAREERKQKEIEEAGKFSENGYKIEKLVIQSVNEMSIEEGRGVFESSNGNVNNAMVSLIDRLFSESSVYGLFIEFDLYFSNNRKIRYAMEALKDDMSTWIMCDSIRGKLEEIAFGRKSMELINEGKQNIIDEAISQLSLYDFGMSSE